jgi:dTDP-3-amino-3,4,6-trideoxy-alpha-D-glucose transaminase
MNVPFVDLRAGYQLLQEEIDQAVSNVLNSGWYILGEEARQFENEFAEFCGVPYAVGVASGTDAILLALRACGIGPGDEVITVSHTAVATVAAIELSGAKPLFVDVEPLSYTMDPAVVESTITRHTRAIVPVHLYGHPADMEAIQAIAKHNDLFTIEDCAQAHGAKYHGRIAGSMGDVAAFSFYPTKNLGAFGDGGMVLTANPEIAGRLQQLRQYGWERRYVSEIKGFNSRLDELQAAILRVKLRYLEAGNNVRRHIAELYAKQLRDLPLVLPQVASACEHVFHLFVVQTERRDELLVHLKSQGIGAAVHYPVPVHLQPAYHNLGYGPGSLPVTETVAGQILSLPIYPEMSDEQVDAVARAIRQIW